MDLALNPIDSIDLRLGCQNKESMKMYENTSDGVPGNHLSLTQLASGFPSETTIPRMKGGLFSCVCSGICYLDV